MYDVKGNKIELVHDVDWSDEYGGLRAFKSTFMTGGVEGLIKGWRAEGSKNIKIGSGIVDYLIEEDKFQEFIDALPNLKSVAVGVEDVEHILDLAQFIKVEKVLKDKNISMYIMNENDPYKTMYRLEDISNAYKQLDDWANEINSATVDGKSLSSLEKFIYAYMIAKDRVAKDCKFNPCLCRNVVAVLNNNYCVCDGYASLLKELCSRIGIPCIVKSVFVREPHSINCAIIKDDKYDIDGLYYSDPTKDSKDLGNTLFSCILPSVEDVCDLYFNDRDRGREWGDEEKKLFPNEESLKRAQEKTKKIDYQIMRDALIAVFISKGKTIEDAAEYLKSSVHKVQARPDLYKGYWVHDIAKAKGIIQEQNINRS